MNLEFPSDLQSNLQELQSYYQGLVDHASGQLAHVRALLESPNVPSISEETLSQAENVVKEIPAPAPASKKRAKPAIFSASVPATAPATIKTPRGKAKIKSSPKSKPSDILILRPAYQGKILLDAIAQVLEDREGQKVNADTVVKELHGELPPDLFRLAKERITKNLSKGKIEKKWYSVPGQTGLYTFTLSKINS